MPDIEIKDVAESVDGLKTVFEAFKATNDAAMKELATKGSVDVLLTDVMEKQNEAMDKYQEKLDAFEVQSKRKSTALTTGGVDLDQKAADWAKSAARRRGEVAPELDHAGMVAYKSAFDRFMRKDEHAISVEERKALSVGSDPDGGYTVHPDMNGRVVKKVFDTSPVRQYASIQTISTDALEGLSDLDEAGSGWVGETASRPDTDSPEFDKWRIPVHELYASPKATQKLLDDSEMNIEGWLSEKIAAKFARDESAAFVTGDGVSKPRGFLTYAAGTTLPGTIEQIDTGVNGGFAADPDGGDVLINALYGLKQAYRANATWFMNRSTLKTVRKLQDSDGAYIWAPGIAAGQPSTLLGYSVASFEDMPDIATNSLSIAVGDMRSAYQIVDRSGIRVIRDIYTAKPYVILYSVKRVGGDVIDFDALKLINFKS